MSRLLLATANAKKLAELQRTSRDARRPGSTWSAGDFEDTGGAETG